MHLEVTKVNKWRNWGEKCFFAEENFFSEKTFFISETFFFTKYYVIGDPAGSRKETDALVASGMSFRSG